MAAKEVSVSLIDGICTVPSVTLGPNDNIRWKNETGDDIHIFVPVDKKHGNGPLNGGFNRSVPNNASADSGPPIHVTAPTNYSYAIYCTATGVFAVGGSDPQIIVTP